MSTDNYWNMYTKTSKFFFCIPVSANDEKFALQLTPTFDFRIFNEEEQIFVKNISSVCWNSKDEKIDIPKQIVKHAEIAKLYVVNRTTHAIPFDENIFLQYSETGVLYDDKILMAAIAKNEHAIKKYNNFTNKLKNETVNKFDKNFIESIADKNYEYSSAIDSVRFKQDWQSWEFDPHIKHDDINNSAIIRTNPCVVAMIIMMNKKQLNVDIEKICGRIAYTHGMRTIDDVIKIAETIIDRTADEMWAL